ncbi:MAG: 2-oxoglutarate ferredoxin oxidoreductase subunit alpha, partial [Candidatus Promineifilaceae bacterium]
EPWLIPNADDIPPIEIKHPRASQSDNGQEPFFPYSRNQETMARPWAIPGTAGLEHRIGGLSKAPITGNVSYAPKDHEQMVLERAEKVARIADYIPEQQVIGPESGKLLVVTWGGTFGMARSAVRRVNREGGQVAHAHLRYINPFPKNFQQILRSYDRIVVPELNDGQLAFIIRGRFLVNAESFPKMQARPFTIREIKEKIEEILRESA